MWDTDCVLKWTWIVFQWKYSLKVKQCFKIMLLPSRLPRKMIWCHHVQRRLVMCYQTTSVHTLCKMKWSTKCFSYTTNNWNLWDASVKPNVFSYKVNFQILNIMIHHANLFPLQNAFVLLYVRILNIEFFHVLIITSVKPLWSEGQSYSNSDYILQNAWYIMRTYQQNLKVLVKMSPSEARDSADTQSVSSL